MTSTSATHGTGRPMQIRAACPTLPDTRQLSRSGVRTAARVAALFLFPINTNNQNVRTRYWNGHDYMYRDDLTSELLTWGAGNLSAFWAFARGCDRVMHLQFRAGELGVSLVQVRAKRFEDSRSMRRTEWGQGDTKLLFRGFEISGIL